MTAFQTGWYLIYTKPRHEKKVYTLLSESGIKSFLPTRKALRQWHDRKKYIDEPLFPSYVFIYLDDMQHYYKGMDTDGFLYYVRTGKSIARVNDTVIDNIRLLVDRNSDVEVSSSHFQPGRKMVIAQGALTGLACEVIQFDGRQKLLVRVDLLQRNLLLTLPSESLMAI